MESRNINPGSFRHTSQAPSEESPRGTREAQTARQRMRQYREGRGQPPPKRPLHTKPLPSPRSPYTFGTTTVEQVEIDGVKATLHVYRSGQSSYAEVAEGPEHLKGWHSNKWTGNHSSKRAMEEFENAVRVHEAQRRVDEKVDAATLDTKSTCPSDENPPEISPELRAKIKEYVDSLEGRGPDLEFGEEFKNIGEPSEEERDQLRQIGSGSRVLASGLAAAILDRLKKQSEKGGPQSEKPKPSDSKPKSSPSKPSNPGVAPPNPETPPLVDRVWDKAGEAFGKQVKDPKAWASAAGSAAVQELMNLQSGKTKTKGEAALNVAKGTAKTQAKLTTKRVVYEVGKEVLADKLPRIAEKIPGLQICSYAVDTLYMMGTSKTWEGAAVRGGLSVGNAGLSAGFGTLGQALIPIPVLGAFVGSAVGTYVALKFNERALQTLSNNGMLPTELQPDLAHPTFYVDPPFVREDGVSDGGGGGGW